MTAVHLLILLTLAASVWAIIATVAEREAQDRADRHFIDALDYRRKYKESAAREAVFLARFGGDNPLALDAEVAVAARSIDQEWADLAAVVDVERIWGVDSDD